MEREHTGRTIVSYVYANRQGLCYFGGYGTLLREVSRVDQTVRRRDWLRTGLYDLLSPTSDGKCYQR